MTADQVDRLYLAGGFANAIDVPNAIRSGCCRRSGPSGSIRVGNAALRGAEMLLLSKGRRAAAGDAGRRGSSIVSWRPSPDFFDLFVDGCQFDPMAA